MPLNPLSQAHQIANPLSQAHQIANPLSQAHQIVNESDLIFGPALNKLEVLFGTDNYSYYESSNQIKSLIQIQSKKKYKQSMKQRKHIFIQKKIKLRKNNNFPKFLCKTYLIAFNKYYQQLTKGGQQDQIILNQIKYFIGKERKEKLGNKNANSSIKDLQMYFGQYPHISSNHYFRNILMRKILNRILRENMFNLIYLNKQLTKKKQYGIATKVMVSRSRNKYLVCRNQVL